MIGKMSNYFDASGTIGFTCDNCGRELQGCTWVNGMKFCAKCYQETFGNNTIKFVDLLNTEMYELKISNLEHKLNEKDQRIAELEEQLKNAIVPKFKIGQEVWCIDPENDVSSGEVWKIEINRVQTKYTVFWGNDYEDVYFEYELFSTKEEAQAKLKELGEKK